MHWQNGAATTGVLVRLGQGNIWGSSLGNFQVMERPSMDLISGHFGIKR